MNIINKKRYKFDIQNIPNCILKLIKTLLTFSWTIVGNEFKTPAFNDVMPI